MTWVNREKGAVASRFTQMVENYNTQHALRGDTAGDV